MFKRHGTFCRIDDKTSFKKLKKIQTMPIFVCDHETRNHKKENKKDYKMMEKLTHY